MIRLQHKKFNATILKQGAQIIQFEPTDGEDWLWSTDITRYTQGVPFRGGIPICWPWFGKAQSPSHGFARILPWELFRHEESDAGVILVWRLVDSERSRGVWDYPFELMLTMHLGDTLKLELSVDTTVHTTGAMHSYLGVHDIHQIEIGGVIEGKDITISSEIDIIYTTQNSKNIIRDLNRNLDITHYNHSDIVVWNPYTTLADMSSEGFLKMVCVETARISKPLIPKDKMGVEIGVILQALQPAPSMV